MTVPPGSWALPSPGEEFIHLRRAGIPFIIDRADELLIIGLVSILGLGSATASAVHGQWWMTAASLVVMAVGVGIPLRGLTCGLWVSEREVKLVRGWRSDVVPWTSIETVAMTDKSSMWTDWLVLTIAAGDHELLVPAVRQPRPGRGPRSPLPESTNEWESIPLLVRQLEARATAART